MKQIPQVPVMKINFLPQVEMVKREKSAFAKGLEVILNDPRTSPFTQEGGKVFREVIHASGLPLTEALKHIGKGKKQKGPTDAERSQARVEKLEETSAE